MNPTELIRQATLWQQKRHITMFEVPAMTKEQAIEMQDIFKDGGFKPFIVTMGGKINVTLFLSDHQYKTKEK